MTERVRRYQTAIRRRAGEATDDQLRAYGMSNHEIMRIRSLPREEQVEIIADYVLDRVFRILR